jgi:hypothetical protein
MDLCTFLSLYIYIYRYDVSYRQGCVCVYNWKRVWQEHKFHRLLCILPEKNECNHMMRLNDKLRQLHADGQGEQLSSRDVKDLKKDNLIWEEVEGLPYYRLRMLSGAEREQILGFQNFKDYKTLPLRGRAWGSEARHDHGKNGRNEFLGQSFDVRTICRRLAPIQNPLQNRVAQLGRPLIVLSICDGIGGGLCALMQIGERIGGWPHGILYLAVEKLETCRRVLRHNCDHAGFLAAGVELKHFPESHDLLDLLPPDSNHPERQLKNKDCLRSYLRTLTNEQPIDLVLSGYPCNGHSSNNRASGRRGRIGHDSEHSGDTWWAVCYVLDTIQNNPVFDL